MQLVRAGWILSGLALVAGCRSAETPFAALAERPAVRSIMFASEPRHDSFAQEWAATARVSGKPVHMEATSLRDALRSSVPKSDPPAENAVDTAPEAAPLHLTSGEVVLNVEGDDPSSSVPSLQLTLDSAIATTLDRNPNLLALRAGEPVASAAYQVAEVYPWNPFVQVQVLPYAHDPAGINLGVNHYIWLMQTLELAHQQQHREASAGAALNQVRWNIVQAELMSTAQTERLYFTALYQRDLRDLVRRTTSLNDELLAIVERRFESGLSTASERTTARVPAVSTTVSTRINAVC